MSASRDAQGGACTSVGGTGEISSARAALEGDPVAPGNQATLNSLRDESRRPRVLREPLPDHLTNHQPALELELDRDRFLKNLRCARRGAAAGPSGMTCEHLRPILDSTRDSELLWWAVFRERPSPCRNPSVGPIGTRHCVAQAIGRDPGDRGWGCVPSLGGTHDCTTDQPRS